MTAALQPFVTKLERGPGLTAGERAALLSLPHRIRRLTPGRSLAYASVCFFVVDGIVARSKSLPNGARQVISIHIRGDGVDLQRAIAGSVSHTVEALTTAQVAVVPTSALDQLMNQNALAGRAIWREILLDAAIQREWTLNVGRRDARARLAHVLAEIGYRLRHAGLADGPAFDVWLNQQQLADVTGLSPVHVNRTLQGLRGAGVVGPGNRPLTISDRAALEAIGGFEPGYLRIAG